MLSSGKKLATALADVKPVLVGTALACGPLDSAWVQVLRPNIPQVLDLMAFQHPSTGALKADPTIWVCCGVGMKHTLGTSTEKGSAVVFGLEFKIFGKGFEEQTMEACLYGRKYGPPPQSQHNPRHAHASKALVPHLT